MLLIGVWFIASAVTETGLMPSGHGTGRVSELVVGIGLIAYSVFRLWRSRRI